MGELKEVLIGVLIALGLYFFLSLLLRTPTPAVAVMSESMIPSLYPGDAAVVCGFCEIKEGDIVVFDAGKKKECVELYKEGLLPHLGLIIHRVVKVNDDGTIETKGDNNLFQLGMCEKNISREIVYGKVVAVFPLIGYPKKLLHDVFSIG